MKGKQREMWFAAKYRAAQKGIVFTISQSDIIIPECCPVLGIKLQTSGPHCDASPSLDRVLLARGYEPGNVAVISARANLLKNSGSLAEHEAIVRWLRGFPGE